MGASELLSLDWTRLLTIAAYLTLIYCVGIAVYRLYLSPLAQFPGPKLAALTLWYEFYYDVVKEGQYTWRIAEMHQEYGPIVRINPFEIHINDPDYYNVIYTGSSRRCEKWAWSAGMFGISSSFFSSVPHELHRRRRAPLNPFFSKQSIQKLEPMIKELIEKLCSRLEEFRNTKSPVNLRHAFAALTMDVITQYAFGMSYNCVEEPQFAPIWPEAVDSISKQSHLNKQMPWILTIMRMTPLWIVERLNPHIMRLIRFQMDMATEIVQQMNTMDEKLAKGEKGENNTIFNALLQPGVLPSEERTVTHLVDESQTIVAAGQVTTTHYLNTTVYHIIANPEICAKLKAELKQIAPQGGLPTQSALEQLPYLTAVVLEGYRISYGPSHRLQRVSPDEALVFNEYIIPPGTPVGMTSVLMHDNPRLFPDPKSFKPERWLEPDARSKLSNYLVNFSRGTRGCLGKELAAAEIYLTLAALFTKFDFELYNTSREDIDVAHDFFNPLLREGSVGLQAIIH